MKTIKQVARYIAGVEEYNSLISGQETLDHNMRALAHFIFGETLEEMISNRKEKWKVERYGRK